MATKRPADGEGIGRRRMNVATSSGTTCLHGCAGFTRLRRAHACLDAQVRENAMR